MFVCHFQVEVRSNQFWCFFAFERMPQVINGFFFERIPLLKINTLPETNIAAIASANRPKSSKGNFIFQPSIFRWELLVSRRVLLMEQILHQMIWKIFHCVKGLIHVKWCRVSSINSIF